MEQKIPNKRQQSPFFYFAPVKAGQFHFCFSICASFRWLNSLAWSSYGEDARVKILWIEYVVVKSKFRRQGVGTALLRKLAGYAKASEIDQIFSTINPDNEASIKLHQELGFNVKEQ